MVNVLSEAHPGCFLALPDDDGVYPGWVMGIDTFDGESDEIPDISIDPDDGTLSIINISEGARTYFVSVENSGAILDQDGNDLLGSSGREYVTFVALVGGGRILDLVQLVPKGSRKHFSRNLSTISISSDIQEYFPPLMGVPTSDGIDIDQFPLSSSSGSKYLCTQGEGGSLTHFAHAGTFFAVDFRCPVGTPIVAVFSGRVKTIRNDTSSSGVHVRNLFAWNSIMLESHDGRYFAEYVHVQRDSFRVSVGDMVEKGGILGLSGDSGFCPEPHLHFEVHRSDSAESPSVPILYLGSKFVAGDSYS